MAAMRLKRASLYTLGCRLNQAESTILGQGLRRKGYEIVAFGEPTDLLVLNTCAVTEDAERTARYLIRKTLKHSPQAFVAVTGCYAQTGVRTLAHHAGIDLIIGNQYKLDLPSHLPPADALQKRSVPDVEHTRTIAREDFVLPDYGEPDSTRALLKIQDGCSAMCSFCIIPFARGHERSRRLDDVVREAESLASRGFHEVVLTGVNIGQYFHDGHNLCALIRVLEGTPGLDRIRISSIEPTTVTDELLELMAGSPKLCPYLHIPLQSGDDAVLSAMNRRHTVRDYVSLIERAVAKVSGLGLGTDLMVGFPGETVQGFRNTVAIATELPFSYLHVFSFSPRPGTAADRMTLRVPAATVSRRANLLQSLSRIKRLTFHRRQIGATVPVLFERTVQDGYRIGTAPNFSKVAVAWPDDLANQIRSVVITAATERWAFGRMAMPRQQPQVMAMTVQ